MATEFSDSEIGEEIGLARVTVTAARRRHGIPSFTEATGLKRRNGDVTHGGRKRLITFNEAFFANASGEAPAYFLGLLAADGSVAKRGNTIEIQLTEPDHHVLSDFIRAIDSSGCELKPRRRADRSKTFYRLTLCSKRMSQDLATWGITPAKTETMELTRPIPVEHLRHFVRGFWDGDGSIGASHFEVGIRSARFAFQICSMIRAIGGERPPCRETRTRLGKPFYVIAVASKRFHRFRQELYRDASVFIERKHRRFCEHWC